MLYESTAEAIATRLASSRPLRRAKGRWERTRWWKDWDAMDGDYRGAKKRRAKDPVAEDQRDVRDRRRRDRGSKGRHRCNWVEDVAGDVQVRTVSAVFEIKEHYSAERHTNYGRIFEVHVEASFNLDALRKGLPYRAERVAGAADIRIFHVRQPEATLAQAQLKTGSVAELCSPKYNGMIRVVPTDSLQPGRPVVAALTFRGARSAPISREGLALAAERPAAHFTSL